jgi:hypothetical protein
MKLSTFTDEDFSEANSVSILILPIITTSKIGYLSRIESMSYTRHIIDASGISDEQRQVIVTCKAHMTTHHYSPVLEGYYYGLGSAGNSAVRWFG